MRTSHSAFWFTPEFPLGSVPHVHISVFPRLLGEQRAPQRCIPEYRYMFSYFHAARFKGRPAPLARSSSAASKGSHGSRLPQFFHSIVTDPCSEEDFPYDSEDDPDDDWIATMDRKRLMEFEDVNGIEKSFMVMWNDFTRPANAVADLQVPLICEAFTKVHAKQLYQTPLHAQYLCHLTNLWDHGIMDSATVVHCAELLRHEGEKLQARQRQQRQDRVGKGRGKGKGKWKGKARAK